MQARNGLLSQGRFGAPGVARRGAVQTPAPRQDAARTDGRDQARRRRVGDRRRAVCRAPAAAHLMRAVVFAVLALPAVARGEPTDDGYCDYVQGVASAT